MSYYNFFKSSKEDEFTGSLDDAVDMFLDGNTTFGPYWEHLNQYECLENVHFVHYEDLIEVSLYHHLQNNIFSIIFYRLQNC